MLKYDLKRLAISGAVYCTAFVLFCGFFGRMTVITERLPHQDSNLSLIVLITDCVLITKFLPDTNEIYRFELIDHYVLYKIRSFCRFSFVYHVLLLAINLLFVWYAGSSISTLSLISEVHLWLISVVMYTAVFAGTMDGKNQWIIWVILIAACLLNIAAANELFLLQGMSLFQLYMAADCSYVSVMRYMIWLCLLYAIIRIRKSDEL